MKKLNVKLDALENFSIDAIKDFEGCPSALKFLKARYGDKVDNLLKYKKDVIKLVKEDDKPDWVINFFLNILKPKYRLEFYSKHLKEALKHIEDQEIVKDLEECLEYYSKNSNQKTVLKFLSKIESHLIPINSELQYYKDPDVMRPSEEVLQQLQYEKTVLESVRFFMEDESKNFTRSITDGLMKLAEAKSCLDPVSYNYETNIHDIAMDLMEFVEIW